MNRFKLAFIVVASITYCTGCGSSNNGTASQRASGGTIPSADSSAAPTAGFGSEGSSSSFMELSETPLPLKDASRKSSFAGNGLQSGTLTAGSFDDVSNFSDYQRFLGRNGWDPSGCRLQIDSQSRQTLITVADSEGKPIGDARCVITRQSDQQSRQSHVLLDNKTGSDGRIMLITDGRQLQQDAEVRLQVSLPSQSKLVIDELRSLGGRLHVTIDQVQASFPTQLDLALVIDTTGSMGDELEYLKTEIDSIVASVDEMFPNVDQRYSLITYRDKGDAYVCRSFDFTTSLNEFRENLNDQSAAGGGDFPEAMDTALQNAEQLSWRNFNTAKVMFLVGDAPPHLENTSKALNAVEGLRQKGVRVFPVGASGVETTAQIVMRTAALLTMGQYLFLTDHSGVGNPHATPDVPEFAVERLDRLMIRMIASELAGRRLATQEVIAIEHGELNTNHQPVTSQSLVNSCIEPTYSGRTASIVGKSQLTFVFRWIGDHGLAVMFAMIGGIVVFERLTAWQKCE